jgi:hypothetical protein
MIDERVEPRRDVSRNEVGGLAAATVLAFGLAWIFLAGRDFWLDESFSYAAARLGLGDLWHFSVDRAGELNMVLYYLLIRPLATPGTPDLVLRLPSLLAAVATVPVVWALTRRVWPGTFARSAAVLIFVTQPLVVDFAFETRSYALLMFAVAGLTLLLVHALAGSRRATIAYVVLLPFTIGLHFVALPVMVAHALAVVATTDGSLVARGLRALKFTGLGLAVAAITLLVFRTQATLDNRESIGLSDIAATAYNLTGRAGPLSLLFLAALAAGAWFVWSHRADNPAGVVLVLTIVAPAVLALLLSLSQPMIWARYLLHLVPLLCCLAAVGIASIVEQQRWRIATVAVFVGLGLVGQAVVYVQPDRESPDEASTYIADRAATLDQIVFDSPNGGLAYRHYLERTGRDGPTPVGIVPDPTNPLQTVELLPLGESVDDLDPSASVWVVENRGSAKGKRAIERTLRDAGLEPTDEAGFEDVTVIRWTTS